MIIEIATHGASLRRKRERFVIKNPEQQDVEIPAEKTTAILVSANAMISTAAMKLCIERQIQLVITSWYGKPVARMWSSSPGRQTQIRRQQYLNRDTNFAFEISKKIILEKISNQKKYLQELKHNRNDGILTKKIDNAVSFFSKTTDTVKKIKHTKHFSQHFLGFEGSCAVRYFAILSECLPEKWQFTHRTQNPGLDSFNASLNYLYGMAYASIEKIIILSGLDPTAGFYHKDNYSKPTLAFDLIETHRPTIDKSLMYLFSRKIVKDSWFSNSRDPSSGIELSKLGRQSLIATYKDNCMKTVEKLTWEQCRTITGRLLEMDRFMETTP